jgi:CubicO group peptidase (beta-lactamase class C family)
MKSIQILTVILWVSLLANGQGWKDTLSLIDKAMEQYQPAQPGAQLSVSRNSRLIFSKAWGMADIERNTILTLNSVLEAGSVSKQITAAAILLLAQQGKLSLEDDIHKYIPEMPIYGAPIRIRHLLHHTSGIRDWGAVAELTGWPRSQKFYTNMDALEIIAAQNHLNNKPGDEYIYSNSNFNLLAIIVQRVSGLSLADYTRQNIFGPAGMTHTQWRDDPNRIVPNRALAYSKNESGYTTNMPNEYVYGNGGLLTCTEDLIKWSTYYQQGSLGSPSLFSKQIHTEPLNNGINNPYAAGLVVRKLMGWDNISHSGATAGYRAYLESFPELSLSIAVLSNNSSFDISAIAEKIRKIFVTDNSEKSSTSNTDFNITPSEKHALEGIYLNQRDGSTFQISVTDKSILLDNNLPLLATTKNILSSNNFTLVFNGTKGYYIPSRPQDSIPFIRVAPVKPEGAALKEYTGRYFSLETNSFIVLENSQTGLKIRLNANKKYPLIAIYKDAFKLDELDANLVFFKNKHGKIQSIKISLPRARNLEFKRITM